MMRGTFGCFLAMAVTMAAVGCSDDDAEGDRTQAEPQPVIYDLCGGTMNEASFVELMEGNLFLAGGYFEAGADAGLLTGALVYMLVVNGIDFSNLAYTPEFDDGIYRLTNGDSELGFTFFYAEAFGGGVAGEVVPHNVFDVSSYVRNLEIVDFDPLTGEVTVDYDEGPLYELVDGEIDIDHSGGLDLEVRVRIHAELLDFEAFSAGTRAGSPPREDDTLRLELRTTRAGLLDVHNQIRAGEFGLSFDGTRYDSAYFGVTQELTDALVLITDAAGDGVDHTLEGGYKSDIVSDGLPVFQTGFVSNVEANTTEYHCDAERSDYIGIARHDLELDGGVFTFADGTTVPYSLAPF
jgi:hypothetical protein